MAIELVGATTAHGDVTTLTLAVPTGVSDGDLLLAFLTADGQATDWNAPAGWNRLLTNNINFSSGQGNIYWRWASNEPASYDFSLNTTGEHLVCGMAAWRGVNTESFLDTTTVTVEYGVTATVTFPSVTTATDNALILRYYIGDSGNLYPLTVPASHTEVTGSAGARSGGAGSAFGVYQRTLATAGAAGTASGSYSGTTNDWGAITLALRPAAAAQEQHSGSGSLSQPTTVTAQGFRTQTSAASITHGTSVTATGDRLIGGDAAITAGVSLASTAAKWTTAGQPSITHALTAQATLGNKRVDGYPQPVEHAATVTATGLRRRAGTVEPIEHAVSVTAVGRKVGLGQGAITHGTTLAAEGDSAAGRIKRVGQTLTTRVPGDGTVDRITVSRPAGTKKGDLLLLLVACENSRQSIIPPEGWTTLATDLEADSSTTFVFWRVLADNEPSGYVFRFSEDWDIAAACIAYRGIDVNQPIDRWATRLGRSAEPVSPSIEPTVPVCVIVSFFSGDQGSMSPIRHPAGMIEIYDMRTRSGSQSAVLAVAEMGQGFAEPTGELRWSQPYLDDWRTYTIAVRPGLATKGKILHSTRATGAGSKRARVPGAVNTALTLAAAGGKRAAHPATALSHATSLQAKGVGGYSAFLQEVSYTAAQATKRAQVAATVSHPAPVTAVGLKSLSGTGSLTLASSLEATAKRSHTLALTLAHAASLQAVGLKSRSAPAIVSHPLTVTAVGHAVRSGGGALSHNLSLAATSARGRPYVTDRQVGLEAVWAATIERQALFKQQIELEAVYQGAVELEGEA